MLDNNVVLRKSHRNYISLQRENAFISRKNSGCILSFKKLKKANEELQTLNDFMKNRIHPTVFVGNKIGFVFSILTAKRILFSLRVNLNSVLASSSYFQNAFQEAPFLIDSQDGYLGSGEFFWEPMVKAEPFRKRLYVSTKTISFLQKLSKMENLD